jgi:hypothetical protein
MKIIFLLLLNISSLLAFTQKVSYHNSYWNGTENNEAMISAKNCYIRLLPNVQSAVIDSLQAGKIIKVIKPAGSDLKIKGVNVNWVDVEYTNAAGVLAKGFLWKGFLAVGFKK